MNRSDKPFLDLEMTARLARVADIQKTAQALLDDPEAAAAFRRVGVSGDFTPQEHEAIYERLGLGVLDPYDNFSDSQAVIQALARRVATDLYRTVFDDEAHAWVFSNTFSRGHTSRKIHNRISLDDFLLVLRDFMAWDKLPDYIPVVDTWVWPTADQWKQVEPLHKKSEELFRKYGFIGNYSVVKVAQALIQNGKSVEDIAAVRRYAALLMTMDAATDMAERQARVADHQEMAQRLLDDPEAAAALRRVGISGDFTPEEHEAIYERLGLGDYNPYGGPVFIQALDYQGIVQAVARRVAAGVYGSVFDDEAQAWMLSNTFVGAYSLATSGNPYREQRISFEDYLVVLRDFLAWDELPEVLNALKNFKPDPNSEVEADKQRHEAARPLIAKNKEIFRKHGIIGDLNVSSVASTLIRDGKTVEDIDAVRRCVNLGFRKNIASGTEEMDLTERLERVAEIQELAQALLDDPEAAAAFRRVGIYGDFTPQEREAIFGRLGLGNFDPYELLSQEAGDYQGVVQALARRVAAGVYRSVKDEEAKAWLLSRVFVKGDHESVSACRIDLEDYLIVLREFMAWTELRGKVREMEELQKKKSGGDHRIFELLRARSMEILRKYGHIGRFDIVNAALVLLKYGKRPDDPDAARRTDIVTVALGLLEDGKSPDDPDMARRVAILMNGDKITQGIAK